MGSRWIQVFCKRPHARLRLFCFPYAGAGASVYRLWHKGLPDEVEVCAIQLPGRESRMGEPLLRRIDRMVEELVPALEPLLAVPYMLFGHSMGAVLAAETVKFLKEASMATPQHLIVSARRPPNVPGTETDLHVLPDGAFIEEIGRRYGGIPHEVLAEPDLMALLLPVLRADIEALETFKPSERLGLGVPVTALGGESDHLVSRAHLEAWREHTSDVFRTRVFAGGHFFINTSSLDVLHEVAGLTAEVLDGLIATGECR